MATKDSVPRKSKRSPSKPRYGLKLLALGVLVLVAGWTANLYAQSNEELLEMIKQMRQQIEAQEEQLQQMEQELKRRVEEPKAAVEIQNGMPPTVPGAMPAKTSDWYIGGFVGGAFTLNPDVTLTRNFSVLPSVQKGENVSFDASPLVGAKSGLCPGYFPNLCVELEFDYFQPSVDGQSVRGVTTFPTRVIESVFITKVDLSVWNLGLNAVGRMGFLQEPGYPLERRLHLYLGVGPLFVWARGQSGSAPTGGEKDTTFSVGVQALTGIKYFITKNLAVFGEYKFKHWDPGRFKFICRLEFCLGGSVDRIDEFDPDSLNVNVFNMGLAFHF